VSAISFGVFFRFAPSTRAIIRSRKVWPRSAVMRITIRSDSTLVPPVTADRSPPASRITGADSPVIADSSTEATPSVISPSDGIRSPASQTTRSPRMSSAAAILSSPGPSATRRLAWVSERILRNVSAWALPRPSATASAKLANSTVRASHAVTDQAKTLGWAADSASVTTVPIRTTNMTGLRIWTRGSSLRTESSTACARISRSNRLLRRGPPPPGRPTAGTRVTRSSATDMRTDLLFLAPNPRATRTGHPAHQKNFPWLSCSTIGPSETAGKKASAPDDQDHAGE
jgi:hypothetical protein